MEREREREERERERERKREVRRWRGRGRQRGKGRGRGRGRKRKESYMLVCSVEYNHFPADLHFLGRPPPSLKSRMHHLRCYFLLLHLLTEGVVGCKQVSHIPVARCDGKEQQQQQHVQ